MPREPRAAGGAANDSASGADTIERLIGDVLPALITRITASELGELEVAQPGWRVRLRRDLGAPNGNGGNALPGGNAVVERVAGSRAASAHVPTGHGAASSASGQGSAGANRSSVVRRTAVAPGVGYFTAREGLATGQAVRAGDVLGAIDVLGVTQPVVAPTDGVVGRILASAGEAVEYGQELVRIDGIERLVET